MGELVDTVGSNEGAFVGALVEIVGSNEGEFVGALVEIVGLNEGAFVGEPVEMVGILEGEILGVPVDSVGNLLGESVGESVLLVGSLVGDIDGKVAGTTGIFVGARVGEPVDSSGSSLLSGEDVGRTLGIPVVLGIGLNVGSKFGKPVDDIDGGRLASPLETPCGSTAAITAVATPEATSKVAITPTSVPTHHKKLLLGMSDRCQPSSSPLSGAFSSSVSIASAVSKKRSLFESILICLGKCILPAKNQSRHRCLCGAVQPFRSLI